MNSNYNLFKNRLESVFTSSKSVSGGLSWTVFLLFMIMGFSANAQVLTPASGSNSIACGTNTTLCTHGGCGGQYANGVDGHTIIESTLTAVVNINGSYTTESGWDYITIYEGSGLGGAVVFGPVSGSGTVNFTGNPGQAYTIRFTSDGSVTTTGYSLNVSYTGACSASSILTPASGSNTITCGTAASLCTAAGCGNGNGNFYDGHTVIEAQNSAVVNINGTYSTESGYDYVTIYSGSGTGGAAVFGPVSGNGTINFTGTPGQTYTVRFTSDISVSSAGYNLAVTYTGSCAPVNVFVPYSGSNSISCGADATLCSHAGCGQTYANGANGYTVLESTGTTTVNINGTYTTESGYDYVTIFSGSGTGGAVLFGPASGSGTINYTGAPGETLTVRFTTDGSVVTSGINLIVTYTGDCVGGNPDPYCAGMSFASDVEPITLVNFAGINNASSNVVDGSPAVENFTAISGTVSAGNSFAMTLKGHTGGSWTNNFRVFVDWNQDGDFNDTGEIYNAGSIYSSNGIDAVQAISTIAVPSGASLGTTRMRVKKLYGSTDLDNPCANGGYGQYEDYSVEVVLRWYLDADNDGYGNPLVFVDTNTNPGGYVSNDDDCDDANNAVHPGATEICYDGIDNNCDGTIDEGCTPIVSVIQGTQCGTTLTSISQQIYANLVAGAQGYRFRVTDTSTNQVQTIDRALRVFQLTQLGNYAFDRTYQVEVSIRYNNVWQPFYGTPCTVTTPATTTKVQTAQCGATLTAMNDVIYADNVPYATGYKFRITNTLTSAQQEIERPLRDIRMNQTALAEFNTTYTVEVAIKNTNGLYLPYGPVCNITTPSFPTSQLQVSQCDVTIANSNTTIYADSHAGATTYRFRFVNSGLGYSYQFDRPVRSFVLSSVPGLVAGQTYSVQVSIEIGGVFGPYGKVCTLTTPGATRVIEDTRSAVEFKVTAAPNPFADNFGLEVVSSSEEVIRVSVYDMLGKLIENREVNASVISELSLGMNYPTGVYNVIVAQGMDVKTLRMIKK